MKASRIAGLLVAAGAASAGFVVGVVAPTMASGSSSLYGTNARGETYGSASNASTNSQLPDLIAVQEPDGAVGYIKRADFIGPSLSLSQVRSLPRDSAGNLVEPAPTVPVFKQDGETEIGEFTITQGTSRPPSP